MTVKDLIDTLKSYPKDAHVVVAVMPKEQLVVSKQGRKLEIHDIWIDGVKVVNVIATTGADTIDPDLPAENEL